MKKIISFVLLAFLFFSCSIEQKKLDEEYRIINHKSVISLIIKDSSRAMIEQEVYDVNQAALSIESPDGSIETQNWEKGVTGNQFDFVVNKTGEYKIIIEETDTGGNTHITSEEINIQMFKNYQVRITLGGNITIIVDEPTTAPDSTSTPEEPTPTPTPILIEDNWTGTWACSIYTDNQLNDSISNTTLRQVVRVSIPGDKIRLSFSNLYGDSPLVIQKVHLAESTGGHSINASTDITITFNGNESVTIAAGDAVTSDVIDYQLSALSNMAITIYFGSVPETKSGHVGSRTNSYYQSGDAVTQSSLTSPSSTVRWYVIAGIDVYKNAEARAVVAFGDSITDGYGTTTDAQNRWTDHLATNLQGYTETSDVGVLNQGIGATLVTGSGLNRYDKDVLQQTDVDYLIMLYGVNDILFGGKNSSDITSAYETIIDDCHNNDILVYGGTIMPFGEANSDSAFETIRQEVNNWIRTTSVESGGFDAVIDFDEAMKDPSDDTKLISSLSLDGLHPNPAGYKAMADAIDPNLFSFSPISTPTPSPTPSPTPEPVPSPVPNETTLVIEDLAFFAFALPSSLVTGDEVEVNVTGYNDGDSGFRSWLVNDSAATLSDLYLDSMKSSLPIGYFDLTYTLTATGDVTRLFFKGSSWDTNIKDIQIITLSVTIDGTTTSYEPVTDVIY